jgi:hypothetical protein
MAIPFNLEVTTSIDPYDVLKQISMDDLVEYVEENSENVVLREAEEFSALDQIDLDHLLQIVDDSTIEGANVRQKLLRMRYG